MYHCMMPTVDIPDFVCQIASQFVFNFGLFCKAIFEKIP